MRKFLKVFFTAAAVILLAGYLIPEPKAMPCCTPADYNHNTFWYWPWTRGEKGCPHTGVDIFGKLGTPVVSQRPLKKVLIFQVSESRIYELTL